MIFCYPFILSFEQFFLHFSGLTELKCRYRNIETEDKQNKKKVESIQKI